MFVYANSNEAPWMDSRKLLVIILVIVVVSAGVVAFLVMQPPAETPQDNQFKSPPVIYVITPEPDSVVSGMTLINITISSEENLTAEIRIDGGLVATANTYYWNTTRYQDGRHTIRVDVKDSDGKKDRSAFEVVVDNIADQQYPFDGDVNIMEYNIKESGVNPQWKDVVKAINPDIVVFVETGTWEDNVNERLNHYVSEFNAYFTNDSPYVGYCSQDVRYSTSGEAIMSRLPIKEFKQISKVQLDDGTNYKVTHDFIKAVIDFNGTDVHVFGGHLKAGDGDTNQYRRDREMEGLINYMDDLGQVPIIFLSDQNSYSPDDTGPLSPAGTMDLGYGPMTMLLYPSNGTYGQYSSKIHNFTDVYRTLNPNERGYTYGHQDPYVDFRIDYIIVNSVFRDMFVNSSVYNATPADVASDHYAISAWLKWNATEIAQYLNMTQQDDMACVQTGIDQNDAVPVCKTQHPIVTLRDESLTCEILMTDNNALRRNAYSERYFSIRIFAT